MFIEECSLFLLVWVWGSASPLWALEYVAFFACPYRFTVCTHSLLFVIRLRPLCCLLEILLRAARSVLVLWFLGSWAFPCSWTSCLTSLPCSAWAPQSTWSRMCLQAEKVGACVEFTSCPVLLVVQWPKDVAIFAVHFFGCWWGGGGGSRKESGSRYSITVGNWNPLKEYNLLMMLKISLQDSSSLRGYKYQRNVC